MTRASPTPVTPAPEPGSIAGPSASLNVGRHARTGMGPGSEAGVTEVRP
jgi:hypothetical protein